MENKKELRNWLDAFGLEHPLVIAGPCSAETEEQVLKIESLIKDVNAYSITTNEPLQLAAEDLLTYGYNI